MKRKIIYLLIAILAISAYPIYKSISAANSTVEVVEKISEVKVKTDDLRITQLSDGNLAIPSFEIVADYDGIVSQLNYKPGDFIEEGAVIAVLSALDQDKLSQDWTQDETKYQSDLLDLEKNIGYQKIDIDKLETELISEESLLSLMNDFPDMYSLSENKNHEFTVIEIISDLYFAKKQLDSYYNEYDSLNSAYVNAKNDYELSKEYSIIASQSGTILIMNFELNNVIKSGNTFVTLGDKSKAYVIAEVSELDMGMIEVGQKVILNFEIDYGKEYSGIVEYISPIGKIDNNSIVTYEINISVDSELNKVLDGLSTLVEFVIKEKTDVMIIPNSAVKIIEGKQQVEIKTESGSELREIVTGFTDGLNAEVITGLVVGDTLLIRTTSR
jgi:multidrug efflux pump subunit AcrA (membrane-fusion protein)